MRRQLRTSARPRRRGLHDIDVGASWFWATPQRRWLHIAPLALAAIWIFAPPAVPIYDGIQADEPYRYVAPPVGWPHTLPPTSATATIAATNGTTGGVYTNSSESGPQVSVYIAPGALRLSSAAHRITVTAKPSAPQPPLPTDGHIVTNVYRVAVNADAGTVGFGSKGQTSAVQMRAPTARQPGPVFEHLQGGRWQQSLTIREGQDIYQTNAPVVGAWALVQLDHPGGTSDAGSGINVWLLGGGISLLVVTILIYLIRRKRLA